MGVGAINPFYDARRSRPMSHFVDESIPVDLMLKAGLAKQGQYDEMQNVLNVLGAYDQESLKGGDTAYVNKTKKDIADFAETMFNTDLTIPENQRDIYKFATRIKSDKKLRQIQQNWNNVKDYKERLEKLGAKAFSPAVRASNALINSYIESGKQGEDLGDLHLEEALNLHKKEQEYFNQMKMNGGEEFTSALQGIQGLYGKIGWKNISGTRIAQQALRAADDYASTPEGAQAAQIYQELVRTNTLPEGVNSLGEYLVDRLLRTGSEFETYQNTQSFNKGFHELMTKGQEPPVTPVQSGVLSAAADKDLDLDDIEENAANNNLTDFEKQKSQALLDKNKEVVANSSDGKTYQQAIDDAIGYITGKSDIQTDLSIPKPTAEELIGQIGKHPRHTGPGSSRHAPLSELTETQEKHLKTIADWVVKTMPDMVENAAKNYDEEFFERLAGRTAVYASDAGVHIVGGDRTKQAFISYEDLGIKPEDMRTGDRSGRRSPFAAGTEAVPSFRRHIDQLGNGYNSPNFFWKDATDNLSKNIENYRGLLEDNIEGTSVNLGTTYRQSGPKEAEALNKAAKNLLTSDIIGNLDVNPINKENLREAMGYNSLASDEEVLQAVIDAVTNASKEKLTVRAMDGQRGLHVSVRGKNNRNADIVITEKKDQFGNVVRDEAFDRIYSTIFGEPNIGEYAGATDQFASLVTQTNTPLSKLIGGFRPNELANVPNYNVRRRENDTEAASPYIISDTNGNDFQLADLVGIFRLNDESQKGFTEMSKALFKEAFMREAKQVITDQTLAENILQKAIDNEILTQDEEIILQAIISRPLSANNFEEVLTFSKIKNALNTLPANAKYTRVE